MVVAAAGTGAMPLVLTVVDIATVFGGRDVSEGPALLRYTCDLKQQNNV